MTQPFDRHCKIPAQGELDSAAGEMWVENPFQMLSGDHNLSAFEPNRLFINRGRRFIDLSYQSGVDLDSDSRSVVAADFDRDGDIDLLVANAGGGPLRLFHNELKAGNHALRIRLQSGADGHTVHGSRLILDAGSRRIVRDLFASNGLMGQNPAELTIGIGEATTATVTVRWPDGEMQSFGSLPAADRWHTLRKQTAR